MIMMIESSLGYLSGTDCRAHEHTDTYFAYYLTYQQTVYTNVHLIISSNLPPNQGQ
jgi:hypothetical protein